MTNTIVRVTLLCRQIVCSITGLFVFICTAYCSTGQLAPVASVASQKPVAACCMGKSIVQEHHSTNGSRCPHCGTVDKFEQRTESNHSLAMIAWHFDAAPIEIVMPVADLVARPTGNDLSMLPSATLLSLHCALTT